MGGPEVQYLPSLGDYTAVCAHSPTVQVFTETMSKKKEGICEIKKLADELRKVDGVKKNGTSDVDSRCVCVFM